MTSDVGGRADVAAAPANGLEIAYETFGSSSDPPIMLIHGLATQMLGRPDESALGSRTGATS
jgi:pimeloyl-ACP methyl ester carboxylesterase